jgi:hypothetical protein
MVDMNLKSNVYSAIFNTQDQQQIWTTPLFACATGNCTWDTTVQTLAASSQCTDVTTKLNISCVPSGTSNNCTASLPSMAYTYSPAPSTPYPPTSLSFLENDPDTDDFRQFVSLQGGNVGSVSGIVYNPLITTGLALIQAIIALDALKGPKIVLDAQWRKSPTPYPKVSETAPSSRPEYKPRNRIRWPAGRRWWWSRTCRSSGSGYRYRWPCGC